MIVDIRAAKVRLRHRLRTQGRTVLPADRATASAQVCERLRARPEWQNARSVLFYASLPDELSVWPLLLEAICESRAVLLPRFLPERAGYEAAWVRDVASDLAPGLLGILEPGPHCAGFPLNQLDLALVPGLGFDPNGRRLGRGKAYYDRLLAEAQGVLCGIAMDWQVLPEVPAEPHDKHLDCILTPTRWIACSQGAA